MPLFDLYNLPYETAMKIVTKGEFPTIVNFFKASTFTKMIIEKNYPLDKLKKKEKEARCFIYEQWLCISIMPISQRVILLDYLTPITWSMFDEPRFCTIMDKRIHSFERGVFYIVNQQSPPSPPKVRNEIDYLKKLFQSQETIAAEEKTKKQQMKRQRKAQKAVKQLPAKHFSQSVKTPRGKSFPFRQ